MQSVEEGVYVERECALCPRLVTFRGENQHLFPDYFNGSVPSFGPLSASLLIVGLAPGLHGANCTGRPFTGDYAGNLLYKALENFGFTDGTYDRRVDDSLTLKECRIVNAVRCVPPQNRPTAGERKQCGTFLFSEICSMDSLRVILTLGHFAHEATLSALKEKKSRFPFKHGHLHRLSRGYSLVNSYHCSRYNTNTGILTEEMFYTIFKTIKTEIEKER